MKSMNNKATINMNKEDNVRRWTAKKVDEFSFEY